MAKQVRQRNVNSLMIKKAVPNYYSGTSGLLLPVANKLFYPAEFKDKSRLCFYSSLMNSIEINSSFYKVPRAATVARWATEVSADFKFTFKLSQQITHNKDLAFDPGQVQSFMEIINQVEDKKGCLLVQFPPGIQIKHFRQLSFLMNVLRNADPQQHWNIAIEFRHISLYTDDVYRLLRDYHMGLVIQDKPPAVTPILEEELPFVYLRFHGPDGSYRGSYENNLLEEYAGYIHDWMAEGKTVYSYFNNTMGSAIENLFTLREYVDFGTENVSPELTTG